MEKINVYDFCTMFYQGSEIRLRVCTFHDDGTETCIQKTFDDRMDSELFKYRDAKVIQFKAVKKNTLDIIAVRDLRNN